MSVTSDGSLHGPGQWHACFAWYPVRVSKTAPFYKAYRWLIVVEFRSTDSVEIAGRMVHRYEYRM